MIDSFETNIKPSNEQIQNSYDFTYIIEKGDTSYSILKKMEKEEKLKGFDGLIDKLLKNPVFSSIKEGDQISLLQQDNNQIQIILEKKKPHGYKDIFIINKANDSILSITDSKEHNKHTKKGLDKLHNEILKKLNENLDDNLRQIKNDILKFLGTDKFTLDNNNKIFDYQKILYSPKYKNNVIAKEYRKILNVLTLPADMNKDQIVNAISEVYSDKSITKYIKLKLTKCLNKSFFGYLCDGNGKRDPLKGIEVANQLTKKFHNYKFESSTVITSNE